MSYQRPGEMEAISPETVKWLAALAGLALPPEDADPLASAVAGQLASIAALDALDLDDVPSSLAFDPRWHD
jgi:hypothetical protein